MNAPGFVFVGRSLPPPIVSVASRTWLLTRGRYAWRDLWAEPELAGLTSGARMTLKCIGEHWGTKESDWAFPCQATIAELTCRKPRTVRRHVHELVSCGLLERVVLHDGRGWRHNHYRPGAPLQRAIERLQEAAGNDPPPSSSRRRRSPEPQAKDGLDQRTNEPLKSSRGEENATSSCAPSARERQTPAVAGDESGSQPVAPGELASDPELSPDLDPEIPVFFEDEDPTATPSGESEPQGGIAAGSAPPRSMKARDVAIDVLRVWWRMAYPQRPFPRGDWPPGALQAALARVRDCEGTVSDVLRDCRDAIAGAIDRSSGPPSASFVFGGADHFARNVARGRDLRLGRQKRDRLLALRARDGVEPVPRSLSETSDEVAAGAAALLEALDRLGS
jgi:hypothetical protein